MERERDKPDVLATRPNGRPPPLVFNRPSPYARPPPKENKPSAGANGVRPRTASSISPSDLKVSSSSPASGTKASGSASQKMPQSRRTLSLAEAYKLAEEDDTTQPAEASPSPAPRTWRGRGEVGDRRLQRAFSQSSAETTPQRRRVRKPATYRREDTPSSMESSSAKSQLSDVSESDFDQKLKQHALEEEEANGGEANGQNDNKIFAKTKLGPKIVEAGRELVRKTSNNSLDSVSPGVIRNWVSKAKPEAAKWLSRRASSRKSDSANGFIPESVTDGEQAGRGAGAASTNGMPSASPPLARSATVPPDHPSRSPSKSFAWEVDADFTAGDLQVSNSPPLLIGRTNKKIDEIRALEAEVNDRFAAGIEPRPQSTGPEGPSPTETDSAPQSPIDSAEGANGASRAESEDSSFRRRRALSRTNTKLDELRALEMESLSRRALATARLDEIRERNAEYKSRTPSPELTMKQNPSTSPSSPSAGNTAGEYDASETVRLSEQGEPVPTPPGTMSGAAGDAKDVEKGKDDATATATATAAAAAAAAAAVTAIATADVDESKSQSKVDSRDLLRRLARATSSSPAPERSMPDDDGRRDEGKNPRQEGSKQKKTGGAKTDSRPTVGFAGIRRDSSTDSRSSKRSERPNSEIDPTERIMAEMKLFAPHDNHSERNSLRVPTPTLEEVDLPEEETPRPNRIDPLSLPTPRVTGAYVDTPATVRVEKADSGKDFAEAGVVTGLNGTAASHDGADSELLARAISSKGTGLQPPWLHRGRKTNLSPRKIKHTLSTKGDRVSGRSLSVSAHRRARSVPRERTPLINSAKPPTVKDDLLEIQRAHQVDDSTLDDLAELLHNSPINDPADRSKTGELKIKTESDTAAESPFDRRKELEAYDRMNKSLKTGLLGIRNAKKGIELLEDKVSHSDMKIKTELVQSTTASASASACTVCLDHGIKPASAHQSPVTYVHFPVPQLWHRRPRFKFTWLGLLVTLLSLWYVAESTMCFFYCKPQYCYPDKPCTWSPDDPFWGYAIPVKLDQWVASGRARAFADSVAPDVADWLADAWDDLTGADMAAVDTTHYSWERKRQHRRRLAKRGLAQRFVERPEDKSAFAAWRSARKARERVAAAREMGFVVEAEDETMAGDERVR